MRVMSPALVLPGDPTSALYASTKQYVDNNYLPTTQKAAASGLASLDSGSKVPVAQLPTNAALGVPQLDGSGIIPTTLQYGATTTTYGILMLAGDLTGTAAVPRLVSNTMVAKTAAYTLTDTDGVVVVTPTASTTITLPTAVGRTGKRFLIKKAFGAGFPVIIASAGGTIDGASTETIMVAGGFRELVSDGTNWFIVGGSVVPVINSPTAPANGGTLTVDATLASVFRLTPAVAGYTLAVPTSGVDGAQINFEFTPSVAFSLTLASGILLTTGITTPIAVASGKKMFLGLRFSGSSWYAIAQTVQS